MDPVACIKMYIKKTESLRTDSAFFVTLKKPHKSPQIAMTSNWIKTVINMSKQQGIGGSTRSASSSRAIGHITSLQDVLAAGESIL